MVVILWHVQDLTRFALTFVRMPNMHRISIIRILTKSLSVWRYFMRIGKPSEFPKMRSPVSVSPESESGSEAGRWHMERIREIRLFPPVRSEVVQTGSEWRCSGWKSLLDLQRDMEMNCSGCQHNYNYGLPAHWCEGFQRGRLNLKYPTPFADCPEGRKSSGEKMRLDELWWYSVRNVKEKVSTREDTSVRPAEG